MSFLAYIRVLVPDTPHLTYHQMWLQHFIVSVLVHINSQPFVEIWTFD